MQYALVFIWGFHDDLEKIPGTTLGMYKMTHKTPGHAIHKSTALQKNSNTHQLCAATGQWQVTIPTIPPPRARTHDTKRNDFPVGLNPPTSDIYIYIYIPHTPCPPYTRYTPYTPYTPYTDRTVERCAAKFHAEPICQKSDIFVLGLFRGKSNLSKSEKLNITLGLGPRNPLS